MEASDAFRVHVDARSGLLAAANLKNQTFTSLTGDKSAEIVQVCYALAAPCELACTVAGILRCCLSHDATPCGVMESLIPSAWTCRCTCRTRASCCSKR